MITMPTKIFIYDNKKLTVYEDDYMILEDSQHNAKNIDNTKESSLRHSYKELFKEEAPTLSLWRDLNGVSDISDYLILDEHSNTPNEITIEDVGKGEHIIRYEELKVQIEALHYISHTLTEMCNALKKLSDTEDKHIYNRNTIKKEDDPSEVYTVNDFMNDIYGEYSYKDDIEPLMKYKCDGKMKYESKIIALMGAVGTGKSTIAKCMGMTLIGYRESYRLKVVNINQSVDYTDLYGGVQPVTDRSGAFDYKSGVIKDLCDDALKEPDKPFVLILEELNRGNTNEIMSTLLSCIADRNLKINLDSEHTLQIPENVVVIATMNNMDKSVTDLDMAVADRLIRVDMNSERYRRMFRITSGRLAKDEFYSQKQRDTLESIIMFTDKINSVLEKDQLFGANARIGTRPIMIYKNRKDDFGLNLAIENMQLALDHLHGQIQDDIYAEASNKLRSFKSQFNISN